MIAATRALRGTQSVIATPAAVQESDSDDCELWAKCVVHWLLQRVQVAVTAQAAKPDSLLDSVWLVFHGLSCGGFFSNQQAALGW